MKRKIYGSQEVEVTAKLHLIMPNAEKKSPVSREVTTANYRECFSLIRESALFEFATLQFMHDVGIEETIIETMFGKDYYYDSQKSNKLCIACAQGIVIFQSYCVSWQKWNLTGILWEFFSRLHISNWKPSKMILVAGVIRVQSV